MNGQNILKYFGSKLDIVLDYSETYDIQLCENKDDYNSEVLNLTTPIEYESLKIDKSLNDHECVKNTITLTEIDTGSNYENYIVTIDYDNFIDYFSTSEYDFNDIILNNNIFVYNDIHYFKISAFNESLNIDNRLPQIESDLLNNFNKSIILCEESLTNNACLLPETLNIKPWAYDINNIINNREQDGWTLNFIFNRNGLPWSDGGIFYYTGVRGDDNPENYVDNNLSFGFTNDGSIKWSSIHYSGACNEEDVFENYYYVASGMTPQICVNDDNKDFDVTITFERDYTLTDCNLVNDGGENDLITEYDITNIANVTTGSEPDIVIQKELNRKWQEEKLKRLGTLKIYINGRPIYKIKNWEEVIPTERGLQPFIQSWGGGVSLMDDIHNDICCFNIKNAKYYDEPLNYLYINHNFNLEKSNYDFQICGEYCYDDISAFTQSGETPDGEVFVVESTSGTSGEVIIHSGPIGETSGTSGTSGADGENGTSGVDGTSGTSGEDGTSGTSGTTNVASDFNHDDLSGITSDNHHNQVHGLGSSDHGTATLAELNAKVSDATLIDTNDSRLSDARTPTDASVTYAKIGTDLNSRAALSTNDIDWSSASIFSKTLTADTTFTFSNLQVNKVITIVLDGNYTITWPSYMDADHLISGEYDGTVKNYIQVHCTVAATGVQLFEVWWAIKTLGA